MEARLRRLERDLLPAKRPTGNYSQHECDRIRAYSLLVHAEIEYWLESAVIKIADGVLTKWRDDRKPRTCLAALIAFRDDEETGAWKRVTGLPESIASPKGPSAELLDRIEYMKDRFCQRVKLKNHGIREKNILGLLLPVGVRPRDIDPAWLGTIDGFGSRRGVTAHTASRAQQPPDRDDELRDVNTILSGLRQLLPTLRSLMV